MLSELPLVDRNVSGRACFKSVGLRLDRDIVGTSFTDTEALMEAAVTGQGIALGRLSVLRSDSFGGKLVRLSEARLAGFLLSLRGLSGCSGSKPGPGRLPGPADRRGQSLAGCDVWAPGAETRVHLRKP